MLKLAEAMNRLAAAIEQYNKAQVGIAQYRPLCRYQPPAQRQPWPTPYMPVT